MKGDGRNRCIGGLSWACSGVSRGRLLLYVAQHRKRTLNLQGAERALQVGAFVQLQAPGQQGAGRNPAVGHIHGAAAFKLGVLRGAIGGAQLT